jgi:hypothetical protein
MFFGPDNPWGNRLLRCNGRAQRVVFWLGPNWQTPAAILGDIVREQSEGEEISISSAPTRTNQRGLQFLEFL